MIDSRKCKTIEELEEAMIYESNKCDLEIINRSIFKLEIEINKLKSDLKYLKIREAQLKSKIKEYELQENNAIV